MDTKKLSPYPPRSVSAENLRLALEKRRLSVRRAAMICGIPRSTLIRYLAGEARPSEDSFQKMNASLGITREELYGRFNAGAIVKSLEQIENDAELLSILHEDVPEEDQQEFIAYCYVGAVERLYKQDAEA